MKDFTKINYDKSKINLHIKYFFCAVKLFCSASSITFIRYEIDSSHEKHMRVFHIP